MLSHSIMPLATSSHTLSSPLLLTSISLQLVKLGNSRKYPTGAVKSHGYNTFLLSALNVESTQFPTTKDLVERLYPEGYADTLRFFHRRNWISRPPYDVAIYPHEFFVNKQDGLPVAFMRPACDIRSLGPPGVLHVDEPLERLTFGPAIRQLEADYAKPGQYVRLSDLVRLACAQEGMPALTGHHS